MNQKEINEAEWKDPRNWRGGWLGIYRSDRDSRLWVPKRNPAMGWTVNTARPAAAAFLIGLPFFALAVIWVARRLSQ